MCWFLIALEASSLTHELCRSELFRLQVFYLFNKWTLTFSAFLEMITCIFCSFQVSRTFNFFNQHCLSCEINFWLQFFTDIITCANAYRIVSVIYVKIVFSCLFLIITLRTQHFYLISSLTTIWRLLNNVSFVIIQVWKLTIFSVTKEIPRFLKNYQLHELILYFWGWFLILSSYDKCPLFDTYLFVRIIYTFVIFL